MEYRRLGNSGLKVSVLGLGCNNFGGRTDERQSNLVLDRALEIGVNFIDTANQYSKGESEEIIGRALKSRRRSDIVLATKGGSLWASGPNEERSVSEAHHRLPWRTALGALRLTTSTSTTYTAQIRTLPSRRH